MRISGGRVRRLRPYALLAGLCLLLYLPGLATIPPLDRDEARFAQATRQMLESGDFLRIRFQDQERNKKPAGIYWLQAVAGARCSAPHSTAIWPYRLPSVLGALGAALLIAAYGKALFPGEPDAPHLAALAALLLGSALGVVAEAHIAKTDAALLLAIVAAQIALGIAYVRGRSGHPVGMAPAILFWAGEIAAIFLKGPVG
ncbi:MAG: ArnT family glycosyltransferase, partial [Thiohalocapsa sp.]